ncbi:MAG: AprI/Inh family metalloprotease inhibitor [Devosia sp.]
MRWLWRAGAPSALVVALALGLAGCASTGVTVSNIGQPEQLNPVTTGNVSTTALPPIGPNGEVQGPANGTPGANGQLVDPFGNPAQDQQVANADGSFQTLEPAGALPNGTRDFSGGLTVEKLLGAWTVLAGTDRCQLNLTQTAKGNRYRASIRQCPISGLGVVSSWELSGGQVRLYDENNDLAATLILTGNRFIGSLAGGTGISMVG